MNGTACCAQQEEFTDSSVWGDPTLADCCIRDLEEQAAAALLKKQLKAVDRSTQRQRASEAAIRKHNLPPEYDSSSDGDSLDERDDAGQ